MFRRFSTRTLLISTAVILGVLGLAWAWAPTYALDLTFADTMVRFLVLPLRKGESFSIRYMHSVDVSPVFERFTVNSQGRLQLEDTHFRMFGAGMGDWPGHGTVAGEDGWTWIRDIHRPLDSFVLRVGSPGVNHTLLYRNSERNLSSFAAGRPVVFSVQRHPHILVWLSSLREQVHRSSQ